MYEEHKLCCMTGILAQLLQVNRGGFGKLSGKITFFFYHGNDSLIGDRARVYIYGTA